MCVCVKSLNHVWFFATPWIAARQTPLSLGFSRQGYWNRFPFPTPGDLPKPGIKTASPEMASRFFILELRRKPKCSIISSVPLSAAPWTESKRFPFILFLFCFILSQPYWGVIDKNCVYLKHTMCCFDIHCEMISTSKLITISTFSLALYTWNWLP